MIYVGKGGGEKVFSVGMVFVIYCRILSIHLQFTYNDHPPAGENKVLPPPLESFARHCDVYQLYLHVRLQVSPFDTATVNTIT